MANFKRVRVHTHEDFDESEDNTPVSQTDPCIQEFPFETPLIGKYIKLTQIQNGEDHMLMYQIQSITSPHMIKIGDEDDNDIPDLIQESTNQYLLLNDYTQCHKHTKTETTNFCIAVIVILIQICSYFVLVYYLWNNKETEMKDRSDNCYGPYCDKAESHCMDIITGCVTSILLIGFLWADFISTVSLIRDCFTNPNQGFKLKGQLMGSFVILIELFSALICGVLVGLYSDSDFDAINGAVGILFVHDLDEKIFQSMSIIEANWKRLLALMLWILLSVCIALSAACVYQQLHWFGGTSNCTVDEFKCSNGDCIWSGYVCNGVENCPSGDDEGVVQSLDLTCDYSLIECPHSFFLCELDGQCIEGEKRCNGMIDCKGGTDEGRRQKCHEVVANTTCGDDMFKCNNGQCIERELICDTIVDCLDGTDEYPHFYSDNKYPYLKTCPYHLFIECDWDQVLCKTNGQCISKTRVCDRVSDCPDGDDERFCFYHWDDFTEFKCGQKIAKIDTVGNKIILFENETIYHYHNMSHFWWIYQRIIYPNDSWVLEIGEVIPMHWRCDGIMDCEDGSDEMDCIYYPCNNTYEYICNNSMGLCIPLQWQCDGIPDCDFSGTWLLGSDDEDGEKCSHIQKAESTIECNQRRIGSIAEFSTHHFYGDNPATDATDVYAIIIPCNKHYEAVIISTCDNRTVDFNTHIEFKQDIRGSISAQSGKWRNDDARDECESNYVASTIKLDKDDINMVCDQEYFIEVRAKYLKQHYGDYGLHVSCV